MKLGEMPSVTEDRFVDVFASVAAPVSVVAASTRRGHPHGTTVSAFCSLSLRPPLVLVSLDRGSQLLRIVRRERRFAINVLAVGQEEHALRFARKGADKFAGLEWREQLGLPRLDGVRAWIACRVERVLAGGDHMIVLGHVVHAETQDVPALLYYEREFAGPRSAVR